MSGWIVGGNTVCRPGPIRSQTRLPSMFQLCEVVISGPWKNLVSPFWPIFETGVAGSTLMIASWIAVSSVSMSTPIEPMRGAAADHTDAGIAGAPGRELHELRLAAVEVALLPSRQQHPQPGAPVAGNLAPGHDRHRGVAVLDQGLRREFRRLPWRLSQNGGGSNGGSLLSNLRRSACSYPVSSRNRNSRHSSRSSSLRSVLPSSSR